MGSQRRSTAPIALDAGALIVLETPRGRALIREIANGEAAVIISAGALAQAWRAPRRQVLLAALVKRGGTSIVPLDAAAAKACGVLLAHTGTADVIDAHVVISARDNGASAIVTSDTGDLARLDSTAAIHHI